MKDLVHYELLYPDQTDTTELYQQEFLLSTETGKLFYIMIMYDHMSQKTLRMSSVNWAGKFFLMRLIHQTSLLPIFIYSKRFKYHLAGAHFKTIDKVRKCIDESIYSQTNKLLL